jgi:DNA-binding phage protein
MIKKISEEIIKEIEKIYVLDKRITLTNLAKKFGLSREGIKKRLIKGGIHIKSNSEIAGIKKNQKVDNLCKIYNKVKSLRKVRKITGHSINFIKDCIKGKVQFPIYPKPLKKGFDKITKEKVRIYAHSIFDGYVSKNNSYVISYINKNQELLSEFENDMGFVYGLKPTRSKVGSGVTQLIYSSKLMHLDILNFDKTIIITNDEYKKIYLKAFFDDEGCVHFNLKKGMFSVSGSQKCEEELLFIKSLLEDLGIQSRISEPTITIGRNKSILRYSKLIGFTHPEKRKKLSNALNHYQKRFEKINNQNIRIKELTEKGLTPYKISPLINIPPSTIRHRVNSGFKMNKYDYSG